MLNHRKVFSRLCLVLVPVLVVLASCSGDDLAGPNGNSCPDGVHCFAFNVEESDWEEAIYYQPEDISDSQDESTSFSGLVDLSHIVLDGLEPGQILRLTFKFSSSLRFSDNLPAIAHLSLSGAPGAPGRGFNTLSTNTYEARAGGGWKVQPSGARFHGYAADGEIFGLSANTHVLDPDTRTELRSLTLDIQVPTNFDMNGGAPLGGAQSLELCHLGWTVHFDGDHREATSPIFVGSPD